MPWWAWIVAGLVLVAVEMAMPVDFYLFFVGVAALAVGLLELAGVELPLGGELLLLGGTAVGCAVVYQGWVKPRLRAPRGEEIDALVGESAVAVGAIAAGGVGTVELRGTRWKARNEDFEAVEAGERCVVERVDGLTLGVRKEV